MKKHKFILLLFLFNFCLVQAQSQQSSIKGTVKNKGLPTTLFTTLVLHPSSKIIYTKKGNFVFDELAIGSYTLDIYQNNIKVYTKAVEVINGNVDLGIINIATTVEIEEATTISMSYQELETDDASIESASPLLQSSQDIYARIMAFEWGSYFVSARGLDNRYSKILINGIEMNKATRGRPVWRNWGGLNHIMRYPEIRMNLKSLSSHHGSLNGVSNYNTFASSTRKGTNVNLSLSNRNSYQYRAMVTHSSGLNPNGWAFVLSLSARLGGDPLFESSREGGFLNAYSGFVALEKQIKKHSINVSIISAYYQKGANAAPITKEVKDLFGIYYNPYWGYQGLAKRNSRIREDFQPIIQISHHWQINDQSSLKSSLSFQVGSESNTRIQRYNQPSSSPIYYKYLPGYNIDQGKLASNAAIYATNPSLPVVDRQINWGFLYASNTLLKEQSLPAGYTLEQQKEDNQTYAFTTTYSNQLSSIWSLSSSLSYQYNFTDLYNSIYDLLGGEYVYDIDVFNNVNRNALAPANRRLGVGDRLDYNTHLHRHYGYANILAELAAPGGLQLNISGNLALTSMQRDGQFLNEFYKDNSYGKSDLIVFLNPSIKIESTLQLIGRHYIDMNLMYGSEAPTIYETFPNSRYQNTYLDNIASREILAGDFNYLYRSARINARATIYTITQSKLIDVNYFFLQSSNFSAFLAEVVNDIETQSTGLELALQTAVTSSITLNAAANIGIHIYSNNPNVTTMGEALSGASGVQDYGSTLLKNLRLANGPQETYHLGMQYLSATYWRLGVGFNYIGKSFVDPASVKRTSLFTTNPLTDISYSSYTDTDARRILLQEELQGGFYININISKSWKIKTYFVGFQLNINNLSNNTEIVTNGFEQSRYAAFPEAKEDADRQTPLFGNKYWFNQGINVFLNLFIRF